MLFAGALIFGSLHLSIAGKIEVISGFVTAELCFRCVFSWQVQRLRQQDHVFCWHCSLLVYWWLMLQFVFFGIFFALFFLSYCY
jgi:hypothetical protein